MSKKQTVEGKKSPFGQMVEKLKSNRWTIKTNPFGDLHFLMDNGLISEVFIGDTGLMKAQALLVKKQA